MKFFNRLIHSPIFWTLLILVIIVRITAPRIILQQTNKFLSDFSPVYKGHIEDLNLGIIRGAYEIRGFELLIKGNKPERFIHAHSIDVSVAWREIFKGRLVTDIILDKLDVTLTKNTLDSFSKAKEQAKNDTKKATSKIFPVKVESLEVKNSTFEFADVISIPEEKRWRLTEIQGRGSNLTPSEKSTRTLATLQGKIFDQAIIRAVANLELLKSPMQWDLDLELKDFNLPSANKVLSHKLPLTITTGTLDLYGEVISKENRIEGYVKPFLKKADIVADKEKFHGFKHGTIEISSAAANLIFRSAKERTVATKINFSYDNSDIKINSAKAFNEALKNGFLEEIPEGLDEEITLPNPTLKGKKL